MRNWSRVHQRIEHSLGLARDGVTGLSESALRERLVAMLDDLGADPLGQGQDDNERTWRDAKADRVVEQYQNPMTGDYDDLPDDKRAIATALSQGVSKEPIEPAVTDAFAFYLKENPKEVPEQLKKQVQRFTRAETRLISVLQGDRKLSEITRADARAWRDMRVQAKASPATIRREKNDISAVLSFAISELDTPATNHFRGLKIAGGTASGQEDRLPLHQDVIEGVYSDLQGSPELLHIWTLLDLTGARPSEIRMLRIEEFQLSGEVPHIVIQPRKGRTLKTTWSKREIPLVGDALKLGRGLVENANGSIVAFPRYEGEGGMDRLSQALTKLIRKHTKDPKHTTYSLRHNMKDRMRSAEVYPETARAIEGHALSGGQDASYGAGIGLKQKVLALEKALAGYRTKV